MSARPRPRLSDGGQGRRAVAEFSFFLVLLS